MKEYNYKVMNNRNLTQWVFIISFLLYAFESPAHGRSTDDLLNSRVIINKGKQEVEMSWSTRVSGKTSIQYRIEGTDSWKTVEVPNESHTITVDQLRDNTIYEWRVKYGEDPNYSDIALFDTFLILNGIAGSQIGSDSYFIEFMAREYKQVVNVTDMKLRIKFFDYSQNEYTKAHLYDWKRNEVGNIAFQSTTGWNLFELDIAGFSIQWEVDKTYNIELESSDGKKKYISFKITEPPVKSPPNPQIIPNAVTIGCESGESSLMEFVGNITDGKAPYDITWMVISENPTPENSLLYIPVKMTLEKEGQVPKITVDQKLGYSVVLTVKDACGSYEERKLRMTCDDMDEEKATLFVQFNELSKSKKRNNNGERQ